MRFGCMFVYDKEFNRASPWGKIMCCCDCGTVKYYQKKTLVDRIRSCSECGLYAKDHKTEESSFLYKTKFYSSWDGMKQRCSNPNSVAYTNYGGRGITYDPKWESFLEFYKDMYSSYSEGLELDRINVNGNYTKENCRWASSSLQAFNRRRSVTANTSGVVGVSWAKNCNKWHTYIEKEGKRINIGYFENFEEAVERRLKAELEYFGENIIKEVT